MRRSFPPAALAIAATLLGVSVPGLARGQAGANAPFRADGSMRELARSVATDYCARAAVTEREGRALSAEALYRRAIEADSGYLPGYLGYARILATRGHGDEALRTIAAVPPRAVESDRDFVELARLRASVGDLDGTLEALLSRGDSVEAARARAEISANAGRFPEALASARRLADLSRGTDGERSARLLVRALGILVADADAVRNPGANASLIRRLLLAD